MTSYYDEVEIEDFEWDEETETYYYPCPCGDRFEITKLGLFTTVVMGYLDQFKLAEDLINGEEVATCPSCSLILKVIYDPDQFQEDGEEEQIIVAATPAKLETVTAAED